MSAFAYKAADNTGKLISGSLEAKDRGTAVVQLQEMGYFPIQVTLQGDGNGNSRSLSELGLFSRIGLKDVLNFTQQLSTLLEAGFPLDRSLLVMAQFSESSRFRQVIEEVHQDLRKGHSLEESLARHPRVFNKLYTNMVRAGEAGGVLELVLARLAAFLEEVQELKEYIASALIYPLLLTLVGGGAVTLLLTFVIPKFAQIFADLGQAIPWPTQLLLSLSAFLQSYWWLLLGTIFLLVYGVRRYVQTEGGRWQWDTWQLKLPVWGELKRKIETARFARTLGTLLHNGVPLLSSLVIVKDSVVNQVVKRVIVEAYRRVKEGERIASPLRDSRVFPPLAVHMIAVGEESGKLEEMLLKVAEVYERQVRLTVKRLISVLEPTMILLMGLIIGFIVFSMLLAIFSVNELPM
ncbi:MAG: type II secretion system inner membrane protein GspF [Candidatus Tectomicrobia bacterium]|uniref:Type II secretion system inner membrane protein GspF n=1 Tax=Tectimicrobiota bacterium TaxID=2528274 RepID=A0A932FVW6_UNCTE|nr:type II secretion system inner membrane protein GspF [Candidatus Tectomicrobia bacterium]